MTPEDRVTTPGGASSPPPLRVLGEPEALRLAGLDGAGAGGAGEAPTLHLGSTTDAVDVVWLPGPATGTEPAGSRVIATGGDRLWSRAPWPAADVLFELPPAPEPLALIAGGDEERRAHAAGKLSERGLPVRSAEELTADDLAAATVVALLGDAGAATPEQPWVATAMPAEAPAVLAARRVLIAPRSAVTFGLLPGTDHLAFGTYDDVVQYADAALTFPDSFEPFRALGARTAERHRASLVYARLADELRSAPRSAAPRG